MKEKQITRLAIFDFDGTLVDTQLPDTGKLIYKEKTGKDWPHVGWWSKIESLDMDLFDQKPAPSIVAKLKEANADENTLTVLLTGRRNKENIITAVKKILDVNGLKLDKHLFNYGGETGDNKIEQMTALLKEFPNVKVIESWDDRDEHIPRFKSWGDSLKGVEFIMNHVISVNHSWTK